MKRTNDIISDDGVILEVDVSTAKHPDAVMLINRSDWYNLFHGGGRVFAWSKRDRATIYAIVNRGGTSVRVHRIIMPKEPCIDHISGNGLDNTRKNLRPATVSENLRNRGKQSNNTSGVAGVGWIKRVSKWEAHIKVAGKKIHLGGFQEFSDAVKARRNAEKKYFGEFRYKGSSEVVNV